MRFAYLGRTPRLVLEAFLATLQPESGIEPQAESGGMSEWKRFLLDLVETVGLALIMFVLINSVSARVRVDGSSMVPTLRDREFLLVDKVAYQVGSPSRGDIVVFHSTTETGKDLVKRIIGLPGDTVVIANGHVTVNGQVLSEPYIAAAPNYSGEYHVPLGSLFVLGDNRNDSSDSHMWGYLPEQNVIGKALLIYWPPPEWAMINHVRLVVAANQ